MKIPVHLVLISTIVLKQLSMKILCLVLVSSSVKIICSSRKFSMNQLSLQYFFGSFIIWFDVSFLTNSTFFFSYISVFLVLSTFFNILVISPP